MGEAEDKLAILLWQTRQADQLCFQTGSAFQFIGPAICLVLTQR
jgi:hypothetical protein